MSKKIAAAKNPENVFLALRKKEKRIQMFLFTLPHTFNPIKFELRPVPRIAEVDGPKVEVEEIKPWTKYQTLFALPYRMIYAVATQNTVILYDTQQVEPFARVSKIHYVR